MNINLELPKLTDLRPRLTVFGVGGAGGNAVNNMISSGLNGVTFVVANTDAQSLAGSSAEHRIQLGVSLTEGLGAGARPEIGEAAAEEAIEEIRSQVAGSHMVFIAAGMGGGTGTGAASVIARIAREAGALTVGVVTKPFQFEGSRRMRAAEAGIAALAPNVDTLIVIPNQNLFRVANEKTTFSEAFVMADQVLYAGIACIVDLIVKDGLINLDFADVRTVMTDMGTAMMGTGEASGERRAVLAAEEAICNPLLDDISLRGARGLLVSIIGGSDLTLYEVDEAANRVRQEVDPEATIIVGATYDDSIGDRLRVSIVASGMNREGGAASGAVGDKAYRPERPVPAAKPARSIAPDANAPAPAAAVEAKSQVLDASALSPPQAQEPTTRGGSVELTAAHAGSDQFRDNTDVDTDQVVADSAVGIGIGVDGGENPSLDGFGLTEPPPKPRGAAAGIEIPKKLPPGVPRPASKPIPKPKHSPAAAKSADYDMAGRAQQVSPDRSQAPSRAPWVSDSGAVFEDAPPPYADPGPMSRQPQQPSIQPQFEPLSQAAAGFEPAPPVEARRSSRRLPEVEDFPAVGQREYRAKMETYGGPERVAPKAFKPAPVEPPRKLGFFERLTGARKRQPAAEAASAETSKVARSSKHGKDARADVDDRKSQQRERAEQHDGQAEHNELPVFFGNDRRR